MYVRTISRADGGISRIVFVFMVVVGVVMVYSRSARPTAGKEPSEAGLVVDVVGIGCSISISRNSSSGSGIWYSD